MKQSIPLLMGPWEQYPHFVRAASHTWEWFLMYPGKLLWSKAQNSYCGDRPSFRNCSMDMAFTNLSQNVGFFMKIIIQLEWLIFIMSLRPLKFWFNDRKSKILWFVRSHRESCGLYSEVVLTWWDQNQATLCASS